MSDVRVMTDEERWERLELALRDRERAQALHSILMHYVALATEAQEEAA